METVQLERRDRLHAVLGQCGGHQEGQDRQALRAPRATVPRGGTDVRGLGAAGVPGANPVAAQPRLELATCRTPS